MNASRSRALELRNELADARRGREVLEQKLELLRRELLRKSAELDAQRGVVAQAFRAAQSELQEAVVELGSDAVAAAALAQPELPPVMVRSARAAGVTFQRLVLDAPAFERRYGAGGTSASLDRAAAAHHALAPRLVRLAELEGAVRALRIGLKKTARRLNALEQLLLPRLRAELHAMLEALEEEERDAFVRRRQLRPAAG